MLTIFVYWTLGESSFSGNSMAFLNKGTADSPHPALPHTQDGLRDGPQFPGTYLTLDDKGEIFSFNSSGHISTGLQVQLMNRR